MPPDAVTPAARLHEQLRVAPLRTDRLVLRLPRPSDAALVFRGYATDVEAIRWMGFRPHESVAVTMKLMNGWVANWERGASHRPLMIEAADDERFVGLFGLDIEPLKVAISYVICRPDWGKGFATEAVRRMVDLSFEQLSAWRVWATCAPQNPASRRVLEKAGMQHEGVLRRWIVSPLVSPEPRDSDCLSITRDDWLASRR